MRCQRTAGGAAAFLWPLGAGSKLHPDLCHRGLLGPVHVKLGCRTIAQIIACIHRYLAQILQLLLFDLAALHNLNGLIILTIVNVQLLKKVALLTPVLHLDIFHHRVFAAAIAAGENTRCCHSQSHHTSALQEITTSHISHFLAPHKLFCFFLFSFARLRKRRLVCHN